MPVSVRTSNGAVKKLREQNQALTKRIADLESDSAGLKRSPQSARRYGKFGESGDSMAADLAYKRNTKRPR